MRKRLKEAWENRGLIAEGVKNRVIKTEAVEAVFVERLEKCIGCEFYSGNVKEKKYEELPEAVRAHRTEKELEEMWEFTGEVCCHCMCFIGFKLRAMGARCPIGKWEAVDRGNQDEEPIKVELDL